MNVKGILIDVASNPGKVKEYEINTDNLNEFYSALDCSIIDIAERKIGNRVFDIVCDDEGLLKENPSVSAISTIGTDCRVMLVGNLFVCNHYKGDLTSLSKEDINYIMDHVAIISSARVRKEGFHTHPVLTDVDYVRY